MLIHRVSGPRPDGCFIVAYMIPGCNVMSAVCQCTSEAAANSEAMRLNREQFDREELLRIDRELRGLRSFG